ncbi:MAG: hypothetical protein IID44_03950 [Planctomycetes bacterium]|nr:hypothetical protein [Planctomycetota bacterium]
MRERRREGRREYNDSLVRRGDITFWFDEHVIEGLARSLVKLMQADVAIPD